MKNPILIKLRQNEKINTEKDLELLILGSLKAFFTQLGGNYALIENQYKITIDNQNYYIHILLFNVHYNCYVVVELKLRELKKEDKAQIEFYMEQIDRKVKEPFHNKTIGIIISKKQDILIANFVGRKDIIPITYKIVE